MNRSSRVPVVRRMAGLWPWILLAAAFFPAFWHAVDFPDDIDYEFPNVVRPTFSRRPPPAYRLAEPGDTLDRLGMYASAVGIVLALGGWIAALLEEDAADVPGRPVSSTQPRPVTAWLSALGVALAAYWYTATPGPTFDGWHGIGWRAMLDPSAPAVLRLGLAGALLALVSLMTVPLAAAGVRAKELVSAARTRRIFGLFVFAAAMMAWRQLEIPGLEPRGYWPRWAMFLGMMAFDLALIRVLPPMRSWRVRWTFRLVGMGTVASLVAGGLALVWFHRPIERLRTIVPGKIYMSAMPTYRGLQVAQARHHFKTIIDLFPEDSPLRSPRVPEELQFVREHGLRYECSPSAVTESEEFLDRTLALAQDPAAWPILVHCHGCMDRTPAWMGIYRFLVQHRPLRDIMREIEQHRGYRPKASVTLLYNRVLMTRAPEQYLRDPVGRLLLRCADGTRDTYFDDLREEAKQANPPSAHRVSQRDVGASSARNR